MTRFNIFNQIHKALRAMLYDTSLQLQQTHFGDPAEADQVLAKLRQVTEVFDDHAAHEDEYILGAIRHYEPSLVDLFEQEHEEDHALTEKLRGLISVFTYAAKPEVKLESGQAIESSFQDFMIFNLRHMAKEESVLNKVLWRYYSDAEIRSISQRIIAGIPPEKAAITSAWMMRGMNNAEISGWLKAVEKAAPRQVFSQLFSMAEKELPPVRYRKLVESLTEGMMVA